MLRFEDAVARLEAAGLAGRGGSYPVHRKWRAVREQAAPPVLLVNAFQEEGLHLVSHLIEHHIGEILDGVLLALELFGAEEAYFYTNLKPEALASALSGGIKLHYSENLLFGEETLVLNDMEGKAPQPRQKPPYPAQAGLNGAPTLIHNIETWLQISRLLRLQEGYRETRFFEVKGQGTERIVECPPDTGLSDILEMGGLDAGGQAVKAVLVGGALGALTPGDRLDQPANRADGVLNGQLQALGPETCIVDFTKNMLAECLKKSCGKCVFCREGVYQLHEFVTRMTTGKAKSGDLEAARELGELMRIGAFCGMGKNAANLLLSACALYGAEFESHLKKKCPAGVCQAYQHYYIIPAKCTGCGACAEECPEEAIEGGKRKIHVIDESLCESCGECARICPENAVGKYGGVRPRLPGKPVPVGSFK